MFGIFFLLNLVLWAEGSSAAVPFTTLLALLAMWYVFCAPWCITLVKVNGKFNKVSCHKLSRPCQSVVKLTSVGSRGTLFLLFKTFLCIKNNMIFSWLRWALIFKLAEYIMLIFHSVDEILHLPNHYFNKGWFCCSTGLVFLSLLPFLGLILDLKRRYCKFM